ncbi:MAG: hypothetical protein A7315_15385 [Candidatus Altiarchaeales archaeon WOR_SM1_79]|nr:MAG: hypothetical protein A7315_15385 [Candidatus Altiarchaeales archaeon WOR_SM1_79]
MFETLNIEPGKKNSILLAAIAYFGNFILPVLAPIIVYLISKEDKYAKFHAIQSFCILLFVHLPLATVFIILYSMTETWEPTTALIFITACVLIILIINALFLVVGIFAVLGKTVRVPYPFMTDFISWFI